MRGRRGRSAPMTFTHKGRGSLVWHQNSTRRSRAVTEMTPDAHGARLGPNEDLSGRTPETLLLCVCPSPACNRLIKEPLSAALGNGDGWLPLESRTRSSARRRPEVREAHFGGGWNATGPRLAAVLCEARHRQRRRV